MARVGEIIDGKYEVLKEIGRGGMSLVYLASDTRLGKQWAIKEYRQDSQFQQLAKESLIKEATLMKKLDHPRLPRIVDIIDNGKTVYIIMDYIEGMPLDKVLEAYGAQSQENVVEWGKQLAEVLDYLHTLSPVVVYRDMKPSNIMLKSDGTVRLFDFGIAKEIENDTDGGTTVGTRGYAAPEQFSKDQKIDARTDIYALGVTLYHLVTGKNPAEPPYELYPIRHWNGALSSGLEWLIQKSTQLNPEDRYQSCAEVDYVLNNLIWFEREYKSKQRMKLNVFIAMVALTVVFAVAAVVGFGTKTSVENKDYQYLIDQRKYTEAIEYIPSRAEAYLLLANDCWNDEKNYFSKSDEKQYFDTEKIKPIKNNNKNEYAKLCYKIGLWSWYQHSEDQLSGADEKSRDEANVKAMKEANTYFRLLEEPDVGKGLSESERALATAYYKLSAFYGEMNNIVRTAETTISQWDESKNDFTSISVANPWQEWWNSNTELINLISNHPEFDGSLRLASIRQFSFLMQAYVDRFASNGVSEKEMKDMCDTLSSELSKLQSLVGTDKHITEIDFTKSSEFINGAKSKISNHFSKKAGDN